MRFHEMKLDCQCMININLYRFPKDKVRRKQWVQKIHREKWSPKKHTLICSNHFQESCIYRAGNIVKINQDAVPTRFKMFPDHLKKACLLSSTEKAIKLHIDK